MSRFKLIVVLVVLILMVVVIFQNAQSVTTRVLFATIAMPISALIGVSMLVGMALGILIVLQMYKKKKAPK